ncbi:MAG: hypothetical protein ACXIUW_17855 [Roseinatronobacter sp.]
MKTRLDELSEATRAELKAMTRAEIRDLADYVHIDNIRDRVSEYPTDPKEAIAGTRGLLRGSMQIEIDDHVHHVMQTLVMLRLALIAGEKGENDLDPIDLRSLVYFIDDAICVLTDHDQRIIEMCERLRQVEYPLKVKRLDSAQKAEAAQE